MVYPRWNSLSGKVALPTGPGGDCRRSSGTGCLGSGRSPRAPNSVELAQNVLMLPPHHLLNRVNLMLQTTLLFTRFLSRTDQVADAGRGKRQGNCGDQWPQPQKRLASLCQGIQRLAKRGVPRVEPYRLKPMALGFQIAPLLGKNPGPKVKCTGPQRGFFRRLKKPRLRLVVSAQSGQTGGKAQVCRTASRRARSCPCWHVLRPANAPLEKANQIRWRNHRWCSLLALTESSSHRTSGGLPPAVHAAEAPSVGVQHLPVPPDPDC